MVIASRVIKEAEAICQSSSTRLTAKRKRVLSCLLKADRAMSVYELIADWKKEFNETISPMSVYRIMAVLENENLVHRLHAVNKYTACAHISCDNDHASAQVFLICERCNNVAETNASDSLLDLLKSNLSGTGYLLKSPHLELLCLCENCAEEPEDLSVPRVQQG